MHLQPPAVLQRCTALNAAPSNALTGNAHIGGAKLEAQGSACSSLLTLSSSKLMLSKSASAVCMRDFLLSGAGTLAAAAASFVLGGLANDPALPFLAMLAVLEAGGVFFLPESAAPLASASSHLHWRQCSAALIDAAVTRHWRSCPEIEHSACKGTLLHRALLKCLSYKALAEFSIQGTCRASYSPNLPARRTD